MRTPRPSTRSARSVGTLIGNGWLREAEKNVSPRIPADWSPKSRSALRKCMFMEMPRDAGVLAAVAAWKPIRRDDEEVVEHRRDPPKDARLVKQVDPHVMRMRAAVIDPRAGQRAWWEDPIALGTLLILAPPIGLACVWGSKHYSNDARWALTVMSSLLTCFAGAVALALLLSR